VSVFAIPGVSRRLSLRRLAWRHPEWWALAACAGAWIAILTSHDHGMHHAPAPDAASRLGAWGLMIVAMMVPFVVGQIRFTADRSLWRRRHRAIAGFLSGYLACWTLAGVVLLGVGASGAAAGAAFFVAAIWQLTARRRVAMARCHRTAPLAPKGWRADAHTLRYGWSIGGSCVLSCWPAMAACALSGHRIPVMLALAGLTAAERFTRRPDPRLFSAALASLGIICFALPVV
jgi:hypothetical protein